MADRSSKVDGRRWVLRGQIHGLDADESVEVVPASLVDELRAEVELWDQLYGDVLAALEGAGVSHVGPADEGGMLPHRSTAERVGVLAAERDALRAELEAEVARLQDRIRELEESVAAEISARAATVAGHQEQTAKLIELVRAEGARQERERVRDEAAPLLRRLESACTCTWGANYDYDEDDPSSPPDVVVESDPACPVHLLAAVLSGEASVDA